KVSPLLVLLAALLLRNPVLCFHLFGGIRDASLQLLTDLGQSLLLESQTTLCSDHCGHDLITLASCGRWLKGHGRTTNAVPTPAMSTCLPPPLIVLLNRFG